MGLMFYFLRFPLMSEYSKQRKQFSSGSSVLNNTIFRSDPGKVSDYHQLKVHKSHQGKVMMINRYIKNSLAAYMWL